ncbi:hypothetical protein QMK61_16505 [Fulvimonas sp. R45]|uniref:hypothetical protein n=1 Tax=Fulvimonas sp. R45 TaxID=3045937 RepID=UPI00265DF4D4|nr:hypothetical protein [Fulvimonas sp. R45]MDO1530440.1 hypothetical protein [Fulvimonas sp. R45]
MRYLLACLASFLLLGCATAHVKPPSLGVISTDLNGGWLLFTDHRDVDAHTRIHILSTGPTLKATCCAEVLGPAATPKGRENFFSDAESDQTTTQWVFRVKVPQGSISSDNPNAMAVWGISSAAIHDGGYELLQKDSRQPDEADSCFGSEGINLYLRHGTKAAPPFAHYYVDFGYGIGSGNCPD